MDGEKIFIRLVRCFLAMMAVLMVIGCEVVEDTATYNISGSVTIYGTDDVLAYETIKMTGASTASTSTDANGDFSFTGKENGTYTVILYSTEYTFNPVSTVVVVNGANITNTNFVATSTGGNSTYGISGTVTGTKLEGVKITLGGSTQKGTAMTDEDGTYSFSNLVDGGNYTVTPSLSGYTFTPTSTEVTISGADVTDINFEE
jgi:hypothetical protein